MGWNRLKLVLGAVLAAANVILALYMQNMIRTADYLPAEEIDEMLSLLAEDGIRVAENSVSAKKPELVIYEGQLGETYYSAAAKKLSGSNVSLSFNTPGGCVLTMEDGDRYAFFDGFGLRYERQNAPDFLSAASIEWEKLTPLESASERALTRTVNGYLSAYRRSSADPQSFFLVRTVLRCALDPVSGIQYCLAIQSMRGAEIGNFQALFAVLDGEVVGVSGKWCFAELDTSYDAQLIDQVNILYSVKSIIDEKRAVGADAPDGILSVSLGYAAYFRADTDIFYLIPVWNIRTNDDVTIVINAVDGTQRTE